MSRFPARLRRAGISPARLLEMQGFCGQYRDYQRAVRLAHAGIVDREPGRGAWHRPDPTGGEALALAAMPEARKARLIEDCAAAVAEPCIASAIIRSVADGTKWRKLEVPMGERQFYVTRQLFYIELDRRL